MSLADDMRYAAEIMEKASARRNRGESSPWSPAELRASAAVFESEDAQAVCVAELARVLREASIRGDYEDYARQLIKSGWRIGDPS